MFEDHINIISKYFGELHPSISAARFSEGPGESKSCEAAGGSGS